MNNRYLVQFTACCARLKFTNDTRIPTTHLCICKCKATAVTSEAHVQYVRPNRSPQKGAHSHRPETVGQQRDIFWPVGGCGA